MNERPLYESRVEMIMKSYSNEWTDEDRKQIEESLKDFHGLDMARDYFKENNMRKFTCCICGCDFYDQTGCNPWPIVEGENKACCHDCNERFVDTARLQMMGV